MGYTHYWDPAKISQHSARHAVVIAECTAIIKASTVPLAGWDGSGEPELTADEVAFNGLDEDSCETFRFPGDEWRFCKTARRPYDLIVVACLAAAKDVYGDSLGVSSDGDPEEWAEGVAFASKVLGREIANPIAD